MNIKEQYKQAILDLLGKEPDSLDELGNAIIQIMNKETDNPVIGFKWIIKQDKVSLKYNAPIEGETNFNNEHEDKPTEAKGWFGRAWIRFQKPTKTFAGDRFEPTLTYIGTGGYGPYCGPWEDIFDECGWHAMDLVTIYSWDYSIFMDDWPTVKLNIELDQMFDAITSKPESEETEEEKEARLEAEEKARTHIFEWASDTLASEDDLVRYKLKKLN